MLSITISTVYLPSATKHVYIVDGGGRGDCVCLLTTPRWLPELWMIGGGTQAYLLTQLKSAIGLKLEGKHDTI